MSSKTTYSKLIIDGY